MPSTASAPTAKRQGCPLRRWAREAGFVFIGGWDRLVSRLWIVLLVVAVGAIVVLVASTQDNALLGRIQISDAPNVQKTASFFSQWGDLKGAIPLSIVIWILGAVRDRIRWRKLGLALLMSGLVAGIVVNVFRMTLGRPRPDFFQTNPQIADKFYGPYGGPVGKAREKELKLSEDFGRGEYQSYPSGHACTSASTGSVLAVGCPLLILPGTAYALAVSWSRMQLDRHHPIDVTIGATIGTLSGLCFVSTVPGAWIKLRRRQKGRAKLKPAGSDSAKS